MLVGGHAVGVLTGSSWYSHSWGHERVRQKLNQTQDNIICIFCNGEPFSYGLSSTAYDGSPLAQATSRMAMFHPQTLVARHKVLRYVIW